MQLWFSVNVYICMYNMFWVGPTLGVVFKMYGKCSFSSKNFGTIFVYVTYWDDTYFIPIEKLQ